MVSEREEEGRVLAEGFLTLVMRSRGERERMHILARPHTGGALVLYAKMLVSRVHHQGGELEMGFARASRAASILPHMLFASRRSPNTRFARAVTAERERVKQIIAEGGETQSLLLTESVKKRYGKLMPYVVNGISVEMGMGECFCLLGPNGAGKTSLISLLTTVTSHDGGGFASVAGANVATDASVVRRRIGVCPQHDILYASLTVREHLEFACRMRGVKGVKAAARNLAQETDLDGDSFYTRSSALSGGMRRRLSIAMAVAGSPSVVFLDEPTTGLDPETRTQIWQTIKRVGRGRLVILSTHSMEEAEALSTRIGIMATGKMLCLGDPTHLKSKFGQGLRVRVVLLGKELDIVGVFKKFMPGAIVEEQAWPKFSWLVPAG